MSSSFLGSRLAQRIVLLVCRRAAGIDRTSPPRLPFNGALSKSSALRSAMS